MSDPGLSYLPRRQGRFRLQNAEMSPPHRSVSNPLCPILLALLLALTWAGRSNAQSPAPLRAVDPAVPNPLAGLVAVPLSRQAFHTFCPFAVESPSVTWIDNAPAWGQLLKKATTQPPPYGPGDASFASQRVMVVAGATSPGPTVTLQVMKAPLAVAYNDATQRLSVRVREIDTPLAPGMMGAAVVGQPCLVLWLQTAKPVREVLARTTTDKLLGRQTLVR